MHVQELIYCIKERPITFGQAERGVEEHLAASCDSRIFGKEAAPGLNWTGQAGGVSARVEMALSR
jgi:hypothetical protein